MLFASNCRLFSVSNGLLRRRVVVERDEGYVKFEKVVGMVEVGYVEAMARCLCLECGDFIVVRDMDYRKMREFPAVFGDMLDVELER